MSKKHLTFAIGFLLFLQLLIMSQIAFIPQSAENGIDAVGVMDLATSPLSKGVIIFDEVFAYRTLTINIYRFFYFLTGKVDYWHTMCILNIICADIAICFAYLTGKQIFGKRTANLAFVFLILFVGINGITLAYPYCDILVMPIVSLSIYLIIKKKHTVFLAITLAIGYLLRPHIIALVGALAFVFFVIPLLRCVKCPPPPPIQQQKTSPCDNAFNHRRVHILRHSRRI